MFTLLLTFLFFWPKQLIRSKSCLWCLHELVVETKPQDLKRFIFIEVKNHYKQSKKKKISVAPVTIIITFSSAIHAVLSIRILWPFICNVLCTVLLTKIKCPLACFIMKQNCVRPIMLNCVLTPFSNPMKDWNTMKVSYSNEMYIKHQL